MKQFSKNILVLGLASAVNFTALNDSHAATYEVIDKGSAEAVEYTYGKKQNNEGVMAITGANLYNFPVQFDYFDDADFLNIVTFSLASSDYYYGLEVIEDYESLVLGDPTANDLSWAKLYLAEMNSSTTYEYQIIGDVIAMTNLGEDDSESEEMRVFDTGFDGSYSNNSILTRSTVDSIEGVTDDGVAFGTGTAPYLPMELYTDTDGDTHQYWLREHGARGFFSPDNGATIYAATPIETSYGGGVSAIFDMNENGTAVGYSSYKLSTGREEAILDEESGCIAPNSLDIPYDICIQNNQSDMYHLQAFKASLSPTGDIDTELLGLLITPDEDDTRAFTSQAFAINNNGVAVGYSHGWDDDELYTPDVDERMTGSYAVMFRNGDVLDFNQEHYNFNFGSVYDFSRAYDINDNGIVVGYTHETTTYVKKFFYVDTSVHESQMEIIIPDDFFTSSESTAFAINSAGIIVGEGQIESHNETAQNPRRTAGFLYNIYSNNPEMTDLNDLLACDTVYNIISASDINDAGQISATATVKENSYDSKGEAILDTSGNPEQVDVVRAILLNPIEGGEVNDCTSSEETVERQGASFSGALLLSLLALFGLRRRRFTD